MEMADELRLLKVFARASGACAFSRRWKWDPQAHAEAVDALVLSFSQFAREIDGGDVVQVHFDPPTGGKHHEERRSGSEPLQFSPTQGGVTMIALNNDLAQAALFHDRTTDPKKTAAFKEALRRVLERFTEMFGAELAALATQPQPSVSMTNGERAVQEAQFERFHDEIEDLFATGPPSDEASNTYNSSIGINGMSGRS